MKKIKSILKKFIDVLAFCLGVKGSDIEKEAVKNDLVSREGQGRDRFGN